MTIEVCSYESLDAARFLREEINALNLGAARPDPFSTFEFYENYFRNDEYFPGGLGVRLWFLTAFDGGRLVGYLPLKLQTRKVMGFSSSTLGFLVTHDTDRPHLVAAPQSVEAVTAAFFNHLLQRRREWSFLELQQQDDESSLFPPPSAVDMRGYLVRQWPSLEHCSIPLRWGSLREYVASMSRNFRVNLRRQMRNLLAAGDVQLLGSADPEVTPALLDLYLCIEQHSWKAHANACIGRSAHRVEYFRGLLDPRQPMKMLIQVLVLDGVPIAGMVGGIFEQNFYALQMVYDDRYSRLAPGSAVLLMGLRQAIEARYRSFNMLSGFGYYKTRWLAELTETRIAQIYRRGSAAFWRRVAGDCKRAVMPVRTGEAAVHFNKARREVDQKVGAPEGQVLRPRVMHRPVPANAGELVAHIRKGQGEFLSKAAVAAGMPFDC
jgi:CelD/BcsL family acetyltransferase involved in cellulose biosynthesis